MTLETAKRIISENYNQGQGTNFVREKALQKEAEAVLRGGMTICENEKDGSRKYTWIKVLPTKTDHESSIQQALRNHQNKLSYRQETKQMKEVINPFTKVPDYPQPEIKTDSLKQKTTIRETTNLYRIVGYFKRKFYEFVKIMDELVEE